MQPFLPILPILLKYPFLKLSKSFIEYEYKNGDILNIISNPKGSVEKEAVKLAKEIIVSSLSKGKEVKIDHSGMGFLCTTCEEKGCRAFCHNNAMNSKGIDWSKCEFCGECFKNCTISISPEVYYDLKIRAKKSILAYLFSRLLASCLNERLRTKYAVKEARKYAKLMENEDVEVLKLIASDFGLDLIFGNGQDFKIHVTDYLKAFVKIRAEKWRMVNRILDRGYVLLQKREFIRVIEEFIRDRLQEKIELPENLRNMLITMYLSELKVYEERKDLKFSGKEEIKPECFPPCIRKILLDLENGVNVPHSARFALTAFLLNLGVKIDEILELFRTAPDFDEEKARYQIEHIAGLRGKGTEYICPSCETMRTYHNCYPDEFCEGIRHPIIYYKKKLLKLKRKNEDSKARHQKLER